MHHLGQQIEPAAVRETSRATGTTSVHMVGISVRGPFGRRDRAPAVGAAPALARTRPMHPRDRPSIKSNSSLVTFIGFYLFSALSGHGGLASSRRWSDGLYGKHHHPLGLSGGHAGCDVLSYSPSALETLGAEKPLGAS